MTDNARIIRIYLGDHSASQRIVDPRRETSAFGNKWRPILWRRCVLLGRPDRLATCNRLGRPVACPLRTGQRQLAAMIDSKLYKSSTDLLLATPEPCSIGQQTEDLSLDKRPGVQPRPAEKSGSNAGVGEHTLLIFATRVSPTKNLADEIVTPLSKQGVDWVLEPGAVGPRLESSPQVQSSEGMVPSASLSGIQDPPVILYPHRATERGFTITDGIIKCFVTAGTTESSEVACKPEETGLCLSVLCGEN